MINSDCVTYDDAWNVHGFHKQGDELEVIISRLEKEEINSSGPEELLAVLEGEIEFTCGEESCVIKCGQGVLIPQGVSRKWRAHDYALLYRVHK